MQKPMRHLQGKVAAITGGASGLGRAMARACLQAGMRVAIADIEAPALQHTLNELRELSDDVIAIQTDVAQVTQVEQFAHAVRAHFGRVHLVCNNAGVSPLGPVWENTLADWQWILGVNLWGVIHGVRAFTPMLLEQNEGHIVNTASVAGLINPPGMGAYNVSKHAVVSLTETLFHDLAARQSNVGCSVLCPAYVPTGIANSARNRPVDLHTPPAEQSAETKAREAMLQQAVRSGKRSADDIAQHVLEAVRDNRFWILTHPKIKGAIAARLEDVMQEHAPRNPLTL